MNLFGHLVGLLGRGISLYLPRTTQHKKAQTYTYKPRAVFEPTIPAFERQKTVRALDSTAIGICVPDS